jgi:hypothetical protein
MRAVKVLLAAIALASAGCGKVKPSGVATGTAGTGGGDGAAGQSGDAGLVPCLDRPSDLPRPPGGTLPCEMLPPGFGR